MPLGLVISAHPVGVVVSVYFPRRRLSASAATKPFGFIPFYPGPGLGGHCIPVDPFYLSWKARESGFEARFIELAGAAYSDPHVPRLAGRHWQDGIDLEHVDLNDALPGACDCIVIVTDHSRFDYDRLQVAAKVVVDTRNAIPAPVRM